MSETHPDEVPDKPVRAPRRSAAKTSERAGAKKPDPDDRSKLLHDAAVAFMERGYSGTSIDDIANVMGVTKGYIYHHCASKSALYFEVQEAAMRRIDGLVRPAFESDSAPSEKLQRMAFEHALAIMTDFPMAKVGLQGLERSLMKAAGVQARRDLRRAIRMRDDYESMFTTTVTRGIDEGVFRNDPVSLLTKGALGALNWLTLWFDPTRTTTAAQMKTIAGHLALFVVQGMRREEKC